MHPNYTPGSLHRQRGTTLIVVLILILLATIMGLFAVRVNVAEQRASNNDVRARLMRQAAEAAMSQGSAYFESLTQKQRNPFLTNAPWTRCTASDTTFPCGTIPVDDGNGHTRRADMFYYSAGTLDVNGDTQVDAMEKRMLPLSANGRMTELTQTGNGFAVQYGVGVMLCVLKIPDPSVVNPPVECATTDADASGTEAFTLIAVGSIPGEAGHITLTQSVGSYLRVTKPPGAPPIVASGAASFNGSFNMVTNPNAAGTGVPISVWSRGAMNNGGTGTAQSCYYDEFLRDGQSNANAQGVLEPPLSSSVLPSDQIMRCDACQCLKGDALSYQKNGQGNLGIDVLQCSTGPGTCDGTQLSGPGGNYEIKPNEFPCDLFQFVFGTAGHQDLNNDSFCESRILYTGPLANGTGNVTNFPADEAYLYGAADKIIPRDNTALAHVKQPDQLGTCAQLNSASASGLWWDQTGACTLTGTSCINNAGGAGNMDSACVGSIKFPVLLVGDNNITIKNAAVFGFMFVRATSSTLDPTTGGNTGNPSSGFDMTSKAALYGAVVVQGDVRANGSAAVIYNKKVLENLVNNSLPPSFSPVPGGWSDRFSY